MIKDYAKSNLALLKQASEGDKGAKDKLILQNTGLVHSVVKRFLGRGHDAEDLFQIGCIGLIRAVDKFDESFDVQFSTYAIPMIMGEIKRFIRDDGIIKVSRNLKEIATRASHIKDQIIKSSGKEPSLCELARELNISAEELAIALDSQLPPQSIYATLDNGSQDGKALFEKLPSENDEISDMLRQLLIGEAIDNLDYREKQIIYMRYFDFKTQSDVAKRLGISQVQVSRLEKKILLKLRDIISNE